MLTGVYLYFTYRWNSPLCKGPAQGLGIFKVRLEPGSRCSCTQPLLLSPGLEEAQYHPCLLLWTARGEERRRWEAVEEEEVSQMLHGKLMGAWRRSSQATWEQLLPSHVCHSTVEQLPNLSFHRACSIYPCLSIFMLHIVCWNRFSLAFCYVGGIVSHYYKIWIFSCVQWGLCHIDKICCAEELEPSPFYNRLTLDEPQLWTKQKLRHLESLMGQIHTSLNLLSSSSLAVR